jgi:hypothetical protein
MRVFLICVFTAASLFGVACRSNDGLDPTLPAPQLPKPTFLTSISLDSAIHLDWDDTPFRSDPEGFHWYRVYSTRYDLDQGLCGTTWYLEGATASHEFLASQLANGVPRCFAVSAEDTLGVETPWSPVRQDTPRPDARNLLVWAYQVDQSGSGFRFWSDANSNGYGDAGELGLVQNGNDADIDFRVERDANDTLWIVPVFAGTSVQTLGPVADLTAIDFAPELGYSDQRVKMLPGDGYVFAIIEGAEVRYGGVRVTHAGTRYAIFDWSFQTDRGNPELAPHAGIATAPATGSTVSGSQ